MNTFRYLSGPCLVCRQQRPGVAHGIKPNQAVCDPCWIDRRDEADAVLNEIQGIEPDSEESEFFSLVWDTPAKQLIKLVRDGELNRDLVVEAEQAGKKRKSILEL